MASIFDRYSYNDRMTWQAYDGDYEAPDRTKWSMTELCCDWDSKGFLKTLRARGELSVSYAGQPFEKFVLKAGENRQQVLALSCYLDTNDCENNRPSSISAPHEKGGDFVATFENVADGVKYTNAYGGTVVFRFDRTRPSQL